ncbi:MAG: DUF429 domain-containing protein [Chloroflexi bacterium]|nr:DUF429 domain-containing protein [Chloroflexota bacterium]MCL5026769.1 DUF429 domain-containing protein [Chloroflexota bacterium]
MGQGKLRIYGIDLNWADGGARGALAVATEDGLEALHGRLTDPALLDLIAGDAPALVLLDIPIDGCTKLAGAHFRPVDRALSHTGLWPLPVSVAGRRGECLRQKVLAVAPQARVFEVYPFAVYKFLSYLVRKGRADALAAPDRRSLLGPDFRRYVPPKYKRGCRAEKMRAALQDPCGLRSVLALALGEAPPEADPVKGWDVLTDQYDACLAAVPGLLLARGSPYVCLAGTPDAGLILLLADDWLREALGRWVPVTPIGLDDVAL